MVPQGYRVLMLSLRVLVLNYRGGTVRQARIHVSPFVVPICVCFVVSSLQILRACANIVSLLCCCVQAEVVYLWSVHLSAHP